MQTGRIGGVVGRWLFALLLLTVAVAAAQTVTIPDRIVFRVLAQNKIDTARAKIGDKVKMMVAASETLDDGTVIEVGTRLEGHVGESVPYSHDTGEARLSILIDQLKLKKKWIPIHGFVIAQGQIRSRETSIQQRGRYAVETLPALTKTSPVLRDVDLVEIGNPTHDSYLVSRKKNIVIEPGMVLLIRHAVTH